MDNGPEFISRALDLWAWINRVTRDYSQPGKHTHNAFVDLYNGSFRTECLNASRFLSPRMDQTDRRETMSPCWLTGTASLQRPVC